VQSGTKIIILVGQSLTALLLQLYKAKVSVHTYLRMLVFKTISLESYNLIEARSS